MGSYSKERRVSMELVCPVCGSTDMTVMPDGKYVFCNTCKRYFKYENGVIGEEVENPYPEN